MKKNLFVTLLMTALCASSMAQTKSLHQLQQEFIDLRFGMFIHFNIPTFAPDDWPDPDLSPDVFNPVRLDCDQWAKAAKSANMSYGCLTTKHHSGFCIWNTQTTDYNVMRSPLKRDVVREYVDAFRKAGLKVMLYYSILDTHHRLRPTMPLEGKKEMIKAQLKELLTNYGDITALIIDGWDAPWSRISYDDIPFNEIYWYVKSLQPECLVMDLNAAKYPREALFYTDIKSYEQEAGQKISSSENTLPALACLSLQRNWFWKESFPTAEVKSADFLVNENIIPYNNAFCNVILNVAPNRDGLMDENALAELKKIGKMWKNEGRIEGLKECDAPITEHNVAKNKACDASWSWDYQLMDFANDDDYMTGWESNKYVDEPWWKVELGGEKTVDMVVITEKRHGILQEYAIEGHRNGQWITLFDGTAPTDKRVKIHRFAPQKVDAVRINFTKSNGAPTLSEFGVYSQEP